MKSILLVEDDREIANLLKLHFDSQAYNLTCATSIEDAKSKVVKNKFHLIILDISLPDGNGMNLCQYFRKSDSNIPIMMLTSHGEESDKVLALELGADDYVTKPFGVLELMARTKALLRRAENTSGGMEEAKPILTCKDLSIDGEKRKATIHGQRLDLTPKEFDLLLLLASNPGKTFSRNDLLEMIWGVTFLGYEHTITSHINRLRIKIENDLHKPEYILTSWGTGYRFSE